MRPRLMNLAFFALLGGAVLVAGVATQAAKGAPDPSASPIFVDIRDYHYYPPSVTIKVGQTVLWRNDDVQVAHTITSTTNLFDSGNMDRGVQWSYTFTKPGKYPYTCRYHPYMQGIVTVEGSPAPAAPGAATTPPTTAPTVGPGGY
jgi:plastocyanin